MNNQCPTEEILCDYIAGRLEPHSQQYVEDHISMCENCTEIVIVMYNLEQQRDEHVMSTAPESATRKAKNRIKNLNNGNIADWVISFLKAQAFQWKGQWRSMSHTALLSVRGTTHSVHDDFLLVRENFRHLTSEIEIEKTASDNYIIRVHLICGVQPDSFTRITLFRSDIKREIASFLAGPGDPVCIENIPYGSYVLEYTEDGKKLGKYTFTLKDNTNGRPEKI